MDKHTERVDGAEIVITRALAARPSRVFAAWTRQEHLELWFGPDGFSVRTHQFDLRPGGHWRFVMSHAEHGDYDNDVRFDRIEPGRRLEYTHVEGSEELFHTVVTFEPQGQGTLLTLHMVFPTEEACREKVEQVRAVEGGRQTLARLDARLGHEPGTSVELRTEGEDRIVFTRAFLAPVQQVFDAFTRPEQVKTWMHTPRWPMTGCTIDLRPGGRYRYEWSDDTGSVGLAGTFLVVEPPHRLVHTERFDQDWTDGDSHIETTFTWQDPHTVLRMEIRYASREVRDKVLRSQVASSMDVNFDQLERGLPPQTA